MTTLIIIPAALILGVLVAIILRQRRDIHELKDKDHHLREWIESVRRERPSLVMMARHLEEDETRQLLRHRYKLITDLLAAGVSRDYEQRDAVLDEVDRTTADPAEFMRQIRLIYGHLQPAMTERLREGGLSDREIEICCLYALGLNGKTIQQYTRNGRHFQDVSVIRRKLGLGEHDRNIDGYIHSLLK